MNEAFEIALKIVLKHEGGYVNHPRDPGGHTNLGITLKTLRRYRKDADVEWLKSLRPESDIVKEIYGDGYWDAVKADELPPGVDLAMFDFAVNSGPARARKYLQQVLGVKVDGIIGPKTLASLRGRSPGSLVRSLCELRLAFLRGLSHWGDFGRGWERRVTETEELALALGKLGRYL